MVCFLREITDTNGGKESSLSKVADHIVYAGELIGYRHVGIGSDFDGMLDGPDGLEDVSKYPLLVAELLKRGVTEEKVKAVVGLNIIRVLEEVERCSQRIKLASTDILLDTIAPMWPDEIRGLLDDRGKKRLQQAPTPRTCLTEHTE